MFGAPKTKMMGQPCGEEILTIHKAISTQYRLVTDRQTDLLYQYRTMHMVQMRDKNQL